MATRKKPEMLRKLAAAVILVLSAPKCVLVGNRGQSPIFRGRSGIENEKWSLSPMALLNYYVSRNNLSQRELDGTCMSPGTNCRCADNDRWRQGSVLINFLARNQKLLLWRGPSLPYLVHNTRPSLPRQSALQDQGGPFYVAVVSHRTASHQPQFSVVGAVSSGRGVALRRGTLEGEVEEAFAAEGVEFGQPGGSIFTPALTLWGFLSQVLHAGELRSCSATVSGSSCSW